MDTHNSDMRMLTSIARKVKASSTVRWSSSVALFNSHVYFSPYEGPKLMDTQLGSIKHITRQLPWLFTTPLLITWPVITLFCFGSLNLNLRHSLSVKDVNELIECRVFNFCFPYWHSCSLIHIFYCFTLVTNMITLTVFTKITFIEKRNEIKKHS